MANWQGFYKLSWQERLQRTIENKNLTADQAALMPEALMASVFLPDLYTTLPVEEQKLPCHLQS